MLVDAADKAERVTCGLEVDGLAAGHDEGAVDVRLVVVAVEQHEIVGANNSVDGNLVRRRGAVEDEPGVVGVEDASSSFSGLDGRAVVDEEVTHGDVSVTKVGAEELFAVEVEEATAGRVLAEELAALVSGAVERREAAVVVLRERAEERGENLVLELVSGGSDLASEVVALELVEGDNAVEALEVSGVLGALHGGENGNTETVFVDLGDLTRVDVILVEDDRGDVREVAALECGQFVAGNRMDRCVRAEKSGADSNSPAEHFHFPCIGENLVGTTLSDTMTLHLRGCVFLGS